MQRHEPKSAPSIDVYYLKKSLKDCLLRILKKILQYRVREKFLETCFEGTFFTGNSLVLKFETYSILTICDGKN